jgi:hypothetical protein
MYFHNPPPIDSIFGISANLLGVVSTVCLGILAIFGEQIRNAIFKPNLQPADNPVKTLQLTPFRKSDGLIYNEKFSFYRLPIKNFGNSTAREVRVLLTYTQTVKDFIPVPLSWTHWSKSTRDVSVGETAYLDVLRKREALEDIEFCWPPEAGTPVEQKLSIFDPRHGDLILQFYERDRTVGTVRLRFSKEDNLLKIV